MHNPLKKPGCGEQITFFPRVDVPAHPTDKTDHHAILAIATFQINLSACNKLNNRMIHNKRKF